MIAALFVSLALTAGGTGAYIFARKHSYEDDPDAQQPGESWLLIDLRECTDGHVHLARSENDGHWIVNRVPNDESKKSKLQRYATEHQAREAFAKVQ